MSDEQSFAHGSFQPFVQHLYVHLRHGYEDSNLFFSPLSIYSSLALALCGASGQCHHEIAQALRIQIHHIENQDANLKHLGEKLDEIFAGDKLHTFLQANGVFIDSSFKVNMFFEKEVEKYFHGKSESLNFCSNAEESRHIINQWVEEHTANKIKELMPSDSINGDTKLVFANAIYFKGTWEKVFHRECTQNAPFYTLSGKELEVPMMKDNGVYKIADFSDLKLTCVKIPFKCHEMLLAVPHERAGLSSVLAHLLDEHNYGHFKEIFQDSRYQKERIELFLPRFKLGTNAKTMDLKKPLSQMGLANIFDPHHAHLERISTAAKLYITAMVHKAVIEVNEEGAEAAAATGMAIAPMSLVPSIMADHPFFFCIVTNSGFPVFVGHVTDPLDE